MREFPERLRYSSCFRWTKALYTCEVGGREGGREGEREGGREGGRERGREGGREGGREREREEGKSVGLSRHITVYLGRMFSKRL